MKQPRDLKNQIKGICSTVGCGKKCKGKHCGTCRSRISRLKDPVRYSYNNIKNRAKQRKKVFTITLEQFREFCIKYEYISGKNRSSEGYTIDRIREEDGYTIDNIQVLVKRNNIKKYLDYDWSLKQGRAVECLNTKNEEDNPF